MKFLFIFGKIKQKRLFQNCVKNKNIEKIFFYLKIEAKV